MFKNFFDNVRYPKDSFGGRFMLKGMNKGHEKMASWGISHIEIKKEDNILDIGCGGGANIKKFLEMANKVYGIDHSQSSIDMTAKVNKKELESGRLKLFKQKAQALPFEDESLDIITAFETIYFWEDIKESIREINRVLKMGGYFLIVNESANYQDKNIKKWADMLSFHVYSVEELKSLCEKSGFSYSFDFNERKNIAFVAKKIRRLETF